MIIFSGLPILLLASAVVSLTALATELDEFNRHKELARRDLTGCIDLRAQTSVDCARSMFYQRSLARYLAKRLTDADRAGGIEGAIAGVGSDSISTVIIFYFEGALAARPGTMFRNERRRRLETFVSEWSLELPADRRPKFIIRFEDECEVPVVDW